MYIFVLRIIALEINKKLTSIYEQHTDKTKFLRVYKSG